MHFVIPPSLGFDAAKCHHLEPVFKCRVPGTSSPKTRTTLGVCPGAILPEMNRPLFSGLDRLRQLGPNGDRVLL